MEELMLLPYDDWYGKMIKRFMERRRK